MTQAMKIVRISPKGQITIPKEYRGKVVTDQYSFEQEEDRFILRPVKIRVIHLPKNEKDEEEDFGKISEKAFEFWNDPADDIYEEFYKKRKK